MVPAPEPDQVARREIEAVAVPRRDVDGKGLRNGRPAHAPVVVGERVDLDHLARRGREAPQAVLDDQRMQVVHERQDRDGRLHHDGYVNRSLGQVVAVVDAFVRQGRGDARRAVRVLEDVGRGHADVLPDPPLPSGQLVTGDELEARGLRLRQP
jgi:hypothetical protein